MRKALLAFTFICSMCITAWTQGGFEGMIEYSFEYRDVPERLSTHVGKLSPGMTIFAKGDKCRKQQSGSNSASQVVVDDYANSERFILMDLFGKRIALMEDADPTDLAAKGTTEKSYEYTEETREIAGYTCKLVYMSQEGVEGKTELWVSEVFTCSDPKFEGLKGFPLEFSMGQNGIHIVATATLVESMPLGAPLFEIPLGYEKMNAEEFETFLATLDP